MNREIKFRAWDKDKKDMLISVERNITKQISLGGGGYDDYTRDFSDFLDNDNYIVMQFTGLKDKNGKEIYEGDVLSVVSNKTDSKERIVEMKFEEHNTGDFTNFSIWGFRDYSKSTYGATVEIVGNIYENPDLIK